MVKGSEKKEALKQRLIASAQDIIEEMGVNQLKARDVTTRAGCALGGIYSVFADMEELIMYVNSRTLNRMGRAVDEAAGSETRPEKLLKRFALAYYRFATENRNLWGALFEHQMPDDREMPMWHMEEQAVLIRFIIKPIGDLLPDLTPDEISARARTWFAAVHGVVAINARRRFVSLEPRKVQEEIEQLVDTLIVGAKATR